jgi:hypothetical protein
MTTFRLGPYIVQQRYESDLYRVTLGGVLIGKSYSRPSESDCQWLERQMREQTFYAYSEAPHRWAQKNAIRRATTGGAHLMARNTKTGAPRKPETIADIKKALAGG